MVKDILKKYHIEIISISIVILAFYFANVKDGGIVSLLVLMGCIGLIILSLLGFLLYLIDKLNGSDWDG